MVKERRLDTRLSNSKPYEMALPSPRLALVASGYRIIITILQCSAVVLPLANLLLSISRRSSFDIMVPLALTTLYVGMYGLRLLSVGDNFGESRWKAMQLISGYIEIILLCILGVEYVNLQVDLPAYWWALCILPVFRLAETGGGWKAWLGGLILSSITFWIGSYTEFNWNVRTLGETALLVLATFIPFYILSLLNLSDQAARFWRPLASRFMTGSVSFADAEDILKTVFAEGVDNLIYADFGVLWELDTFEDRPVLRRRYEFRREPLSTNLKYLRKMYRPGTTSTEELIVPAGSVLRSLANLNGILNSSDHAEKSARMDNLPWRARYEQGIDSWMVVPIYAEKNVRPVGFFEIGMSLKPGGRGQLAIEERVNAIADTLGEVYGRIQQIQANQLKQKFAELEHEVTDEIALHNAAIQIASDYFRRSVLIVDYSMVLGRIETVFGSWPPDKIEWLGKSIREQELEVSKIDQLSVFRLPDPTQSNQMDTEYYFVRPVILRSGSVVEALILVNDVEELTTADRQILHDSARTLNAIIAPRRAASLLQPDSSTSLEPLATRGRLTQLARQVKEDRSADVVVLYEFAAGRPKPSPIIVGDLNEPEYLAKPIVIEADNPILQVALLGEAKFYPRIQSEALGNGLNRHGDPRFTVREGIISSVGLPLKTDQEVVGVMWINFRKPQKFDGSDRRYYSDLLRVLPQRLASLQIIATTKSHAEQMARDHLRADLHDNILQEVIASGAYLSVIQSKMRAGQPQEAQGDISHLVSALSDTEVKIRELLDDLRETPQNTDLVNRLNEFADHLQSEFGVPHELKIYGLEAIPPEYNKQLGLVIEEVMRNAAKHGKATRVVIQGTRSDDILQLIITDNGVGFDPRPEHYGHGIQGMQARLRWLNGKMSIASKAGETGTGIVIEVHMTRPEEAE